MRSSADRPEPSPNPVRTINLALQGGGAHGAFTWGVLDRLLDEKELAFEGVSATSAGAMNAAAFAYGLAVDGREGARKSLTDYWKRVSEAARLGPLQPSCDRPDAGRSQAVVVADFPPDRLRVADAVALSVQPGELQPFA
jgi:predicted acylesterase/phospholipase RssA